MKTAVIRGGNERIPSARKASGLVVTGSIGADETTGCAAGAATYRLGMGGVLNSV